MSFMQGQAPQAASLPPPPPPPMPSPVPVPDAPTAAAAASGRDIKNLSLTPGLIKRVETERKAAGLPKDALVDEATMEKLDANNELLAARRQAGARDAR